MFSSPRSLAASRSVASTSAPSAAMATALARPMPCPAPLTKTRLPWSLPAMDVFPSLVSLHSAVRRGARQPGGPGSSGQSCFG
jgi:hypothetical protein